MAKNFENFCGLLLDAEFQKINVFCFQIKHGMQGVK
jgi:hypothetical protein